MQFKFTKSALHSAGSELALKQVSRLLRLPRFEPTAQVPKLATRLSRRDAHPHVAMGHHRSPSTPQLVSPQQTQAHLALPSARTTYERAGNRRVGTNSEEATNKALRLSSLLLATVTVDLEQNRLRSSPDTEK